MGHQPFSVIYVLASKGLISRMTVLGLHSIIWGIKHTIHYLHDAKWGSDEVCKNNLGLLVKERLITGWYTVIEQSPYVECIYRYSNRAVKTVLYEHIMGHN